MERRQQRSKVAAGLERGVDRGAGVRRSEHGQRCERGDGAASGAEQHRRLLDPSGPDVLRKVVADPHLRHGVCASKSKSMYSMLLRVCTM